MPISSRLAQLRAAGRAPVGRQQAEQRHRGLRLARAGLADDGEHLAREDVVAHAGRGRVPLSRRRRSRRRGHGRSAPASASAMRRGRRRRCRLPRWFLTGRGRGARWTGSPSPSTGLGAWRAWVPRRSSVRSYGRWLTGGAAAAAVIALVSVLVADGARRGPAPAAADGPRRAAGLGAVLATGRRGVRRRGRGAQRPGDRAHPVARVPRRDREVLARRAHDRRRRDRVGRTPVQRYRAAHASPPPAGAVRSAPAGTTRTPSGSPTRSSSGRPPSRTPGYLDGAEAALAAGVAPQRRWHWPLIGAVLVLAAASARPALIARVTNRAPRSDPAAAAAWRSCPASATARRRTGRGPSCARTGCASAAGRTRRADRRR